MRVATVIFLLAWFGAPQQPAVQPPTPIPSTHLETRWAADVTPDRVLPEYPRPQLARHDWINLNGTWEYAVTPADAPRPSTFDGRILVPFPVESQLSGAGVWVSPEERLWYRRTFTAPPLARGGRLLLNFGAVDFEARVYINGTLAGEHRGGYDPFTIDITDHLKSGSSRTPPAGSGSDGGTSPTDVASGFSRTEPEQEIIVAVTDPTDQGQQPRGKQVRRPRGIWYTEVTGIWQTVWLEAVPAAHVTALRIDPDLEHESVHLTVSATGSGVRWTAVALAGTRTAGTVSGRAGETATLRLPSPHAWSPSDPFLYTLRIKAGDDQVESYFGMRSIAVGPDAAGVQRLLLNGRPLFELGLLDQGWWPDGLYTAPTDEALASDIQRMRDLGFNMIRKHVKVEPDALVLPRGPARACWCGRTCRAATTKVRRLRTHSAAS